MFQKVKEAIISHKMLCIVYVNTRGEVIERVICPLKMVYKAWCGIKKVDSLFSRIS